jgi:hypothetical protein
MGTKKRSVSKRFFWIYLAGFADGCRICDYPLMLIISNKPPGFRPDDPRHVRVCHGGDALAALFSATGSISPHESDHWQHAGFAVVCAAGFHGNFTTARWYGLLGIGMARRIGCQGFCRYSAADKKATGLACSMLFRMFCFWEFLMGWCMMFLFRG